MREILLQFPKQLEEGYMIVASISPTIAVSKECSM